MIADAWVGTYTVPARATPVDISVRVHGTTATVALGRGHAASTDVLVTIRHKRIRFTFPERLVFDGTVRGSTLTGTVRQGSLRGAFRLRRGTSKVLPLFGLYRSAAGDVVTVNQAEGFAPWLVELPGGAVHGIGPSRTVGDRLGDTSGNGALAVARNALTWKGVRYARVPLRQREVRVGADAATLTLPPGPGPFPAVAMVHGSGRNTREEFQTFTAYCASLGIAVLADDKRGVGQSLGTYPGEAATADTLDVLARDAEAEVRYLAKLPQVDSARVGLLGDSQAGWIIALAAAREPAVAWAVALAGPVATVGETDYWGTLAGKSQAPKSASDAEMLKAVRAAGPSGFDPRPSLQKTTIPVLWVLGDDDRNVPTQLSIERLQQLDKGHDFTWTVIHSTHALLELPNGLYDSLPRSHGFAEGLFPAVGAWLRSHGIVR